MMTDRTLTAGLLTLLILLIMGIPVHAADNARLVRLTTTTSTTNSGLIDKLKPAFEADTGYTLQVEAYGSGRALHSARVGNADVVIVHAPMAEEKFMREGYGLSRQSLMKNEFIIAGPKDDPAGLTGNQDVVKAFRAIAAKQARFVSRGDDSGTHKKELNIWSKANIEPYGKWYIEYGQGMGKTLAYGDEVHAYVLVDRATWLARRGRLNLVQLLHGDKLLDNTYHIIAVNPAKLNSVNKPGAQRFIKWILSKQGQEIIRRFTVDDVRLFTPVR